MANFTCITCSSRDILILHTKITTKVYNKNQADIKQCPTQWLRAFVLNNKEIGIEKRSTTLKIGEKWVKTMLLFFPHSNQMTRNRGHLISNSLCYLHRMRFKHHIVSFFSFNFRLGSNANPSRNENVPRVCLYDKASIIGCTLCKYIMCITL